MNLDSMTRQVLPTAPGTAGVTVTATVEKSRRPREREGKMQSE